MAILYAQLIKHTQCWQIAMEISHAAISHICRIVHIISFTKFAIECNLKKRNDHSCMQSEICYVRRARHIYHITPRSTALQHLKYWQIKRFLILMYFFIIFFFIILLMLFIFANLCFCCCCFHLCWVLFFVVVHILFEGLFALVIVCMYTIYYVYSCCCCCVRVVVVVVERKNH